MIIEIEGADGLGKRKGESAGMILGGTVEGIERGD